MGNSRRGQGEGSIRRRKRKDGSPGLYEARYIDADDKPRSIYGQKRADVAKRLKEATGEAEQGIRPTTDRDTVATLLTTWLESIRLNVRPSTWAQYESYTRVHLIPSLGAIPIRKLSPEAVEEMMNKKASPKPDGAGLSPRTVSHMRAILRDALNHAVKRSVVSRNVAALAKPPRTARVEVRVLDGKAAKVFLAAVADLPMGPLYTVALVYGLRLGECLGLRWSDIDEQARTLSVRQAYQRVGRRGLFVEPKSDMSRRTLPLFQLADQALRTQRVLQAERRLIAGGSTAEHGAWEDHDLVFSDAFGRPLNPSSTTRGLRRALEELRIPSMRFHDLRHSCASLHNEMGTDPRTVQFLLGHTSAELTLKVYTHITDAQMRAAAARLDKGLGPKRTHSRTHSDPKPIRTGA